MRLDDDVRSALAPLLALVEGGRASRVVAMPDLVTVEAPEGSSTVAVDWSHERHARACEALAGRVVPGDGVAAAVIGEALVLRVAPRPERRTDDVIRDGLVSPLAGRALSAAVGLGRNVVVAGSWAAAAQLVAALVADGKRPCFVGEPGDPSPRGWPLVTGGRDALVYGADRIGCWSSSPAIAGVLLRERSGVVAWIDARRLDRALMRLELALAAGPGASALHVLASVDLVAVVGEVPSVRVVEVAEIGLVEDGYRPRLLFGSGIPPVPAALVPLDAPSFLGELAQAGYGVLADELRSAIPSAAGLREAPVAGTSRPAGEAARAGRGGVATRGRETAPAPRAAVAPPPAAGPGAAESPPPGWELDRLGLDGSETENGGANASAEDASLAATYGLGPPPRPAGVRPEAGGSFEDALRRARGRADDDEPT